MLPPLPVLVLLPLAVAAAWFRGGRPERTAAAAILIAWALGLALADWRIDRTSAGLVLGDLGLMLALGRLTLRHDRWWLLLATAIQGLAVAAHLALALLPDLTEMANFAALTVFRLLLLFGLLSGVLERWLAAEPPAAEAGKTVRA